MDGKLMALAYFVNRKLLDKVKTEAEYNQLIVTAIAIVIQDVPPPCTTEKCSNLPIPIPCDSPEYVTQ